jgi:hypothetical protein
MGPRRATKDARERIGRRGGRCALRGASASGESGSALVEAALVIPVLVLIIYWSAAMTDVLVLKIKSSEAARFALWETTVFRSGPEIAGDVARRFADLRSAAGLELSDTGLMLYPRAQDMVWSAEVDASSRTVPIGGEARMPPTSGLVLRLANAVLGALPRAIDAELARERFNVHGEAEVRVRLERASHLGSAILNGGDLVGRRGGGDLDHPHSMAHWSFETPLPSQNPMRLVFDTWKAWPRPLRFTANGAPADPSASPMRSYPVVEEQVSAQVDKIAFFGLRRTAALGKISGLLARVVNSGLMRSMLGGNAPDVFGTGRMDGRGLRGPITILPAERPDVGWVPGQGLNVQRIGDVGTASERAVWLTSNEAMTRHRGGADYSRYTVPYRINTHYWRQDGGVDGRTRRPLLEQPARAVEVYGNGYVETFHCRGHYFAGAVRDGVTDWRKRYRFARCIGD